MGMIPKIRQGYYSTKLGGFTVQVVMPPEWADPNDVWWSAEDRRYANYDPWAEFEQPSGSHLVIEVRPWVVTKYTPKGVKIRQRFSGEIFVLGTALRQTAVPTIELAVRDLIAKKKRHVQGAEYRLLEARQHYAAAERVLHELQID